VTELELRLSALRDEVAFPPTPDLDVPGRVLRRVAWKPRLAVAFAVLLAVAAGVLALSPGARSAFRDLLGIGGATLTRVERLPRPTAPVGIAPGEVVTLAEARRAVSYRVRLPLGGERPREVLLDENVAGGAITIVWCCAPELVLTQFPGTTTVEFVRKLATEATTVEEVTVDGERGYWISGAEHAVGFVDAFGTFHDGETRLAGNVLLWRDGDVTLRLEGEIGKSEALAYAEAIG